MNNINYKKAVDDIFNALPVDLITGQDLNIYNENLNLELISPIEIECPKCNYKNLTLTAGYINCKKCQKLFDTLEDETDLKGCACNLVWSIPDWLVNQIDPKIFTKFGLTVWKENENLDYFVGINGARYSFMEQHFKPFLDYLFKNKIIYKQDYLQ